MLRTPSQFLLMPGSKAEPKQEMSDQQHARETVKQTSLPKQNDKANKKLTKHTFTTEHLEKTS